ncbi:hypothetical protein ACVW0K_000217 [Streptomyces filamentosus]
MSARGRSVVSPLEETGVGRSEEAGGECPEGTVVSPRQGRPASG